MASGIARDWARNESPMTSEKVLVQRGEALYHDKARAGGEVISDIRVHRSCGLVAWPRLRAHVAETGMSAQGCGHGTRRTSAALADSFTCTDCGF